MSSSSLSPPPPSVLSLLFPRSARAQTSTLLPHLQADPSLFNVQASLDIDELKKRGHSAVDSAAATASKAQETARRELTKAEKAATSARDAVKRTADEEIPRKLNEGLDKAKDQATQAVDSVRGSLAKGVNRSVAAVEAVGAKMDDAARAIRPETIDRRDVDRPGSIRLFSPEYYATCALGGALACVCISRADIYQGRDALAFCPFASTQCADLYMSPLRAQLILL